jgi:hypothetical protein
VEQISRADAVPIVTKYEWLGDTKGTLFVGLLSPLRDLQGVACFGWGPGGGKEKSNGKWGTIRDIIGGPALCLERGACVHYAPPNAASFLITHACQLIHRVNKIGIFFAYGDPSAGEYGAVYQAANWCYIGQGITNGKKRELRYSVLAPGDDPNVPSNWKTTRALRTATRHLSFKQAEAEGWTIAKRPAKHVYATCIGKDRRGWRKRFAGKAYPSPRPELKIAAHRLDKSLSQG